MVWAFLNRLIQYHDGNEWEGHHWSVMRWYRIYTAGQCRSRPVENAPLHSPCEKFPVPRTWCVRLEGNNSTSPLTSSFCLVCFMTLCRTAAMSAASLCSDWIRWECEGKRWRRNIGCRMEEVESLFDMGWNKIVSWSGDKMETPLLWCVF